MQILKIRDFRLNLPQIPKLLLIILINSDVFNASVDMGKPV